LAAERAWKAFESEVLPLDKLEAQMATKTEAHRSFYEVSGLGPRWPEEPTLVPTENFLHHFVRDALPEDFATSISEHCRLPPGSHCDNVLRGLADLLLYGDIDRNATREDLLAEVEARGLEELAQMGIALARGLQQEESERRALLGAYRRVRGTASSSTFEVMINVRV